MTSRLCNVCAKLNIEALVSEQGFILHDNILELQASSKSCYLCDQAFKQVWPSGSKPEDLTGSADSLVKLQARAFYRQHTHHKEGLTFVLFHVGSQTPVQGESSAWLLVRTLDGDPAERLGVKTLRLLPENTSSSESTYQGLKWLKECLLSQDHFETCSHTRDRELDRSFADTTGCDDKLIDLPGPGRSGGSLEKTERRHDQLRKDIMYLYNKKLKSQGGEAVTEERPVRLVEIIDTGPNATLRLVNGLSDCTPYVALSYRWGGLEAVWQTTVENSGSRCVQFSLNSSLNAIAGLHNDASTSMLKTEDSINISNTLSTGEESSVYLFPEQKTKLDQSITNIRDMGDLLSHCSLRNRGWTMQERILSPRIIHYASDQLYWECQHGIQESQDELLHISRSFTIPKIARRIKSVDNDEEKRKELRKMLYYWYVHLIGGDYSRRSLTYGEDKLVAIGGVARALDDIEPMGYMVGHWGEDDDELVKSLCWTRGGPGQKSDNYRAPSWSWASQDSAIDYRNYSLVGSGNDTIVAEPVTWQASAPDGTFFGRCTNAFLQLKAKFARGTVYPNCGHDFSDYHQTGAGGGYTVDLPKERCAFLILEGGEISDVVWLDQSQATKDPVREGIDVKVVMLSEIRPDGEDHYPGACLICTLDERYHLTRIGFTESIKPYKEGQGREAPPVDGPKLCDKEPMELIII
ncbi:hypothetical protein ACLX1H_004720 [Fusarium chlamydosporum]